MAATRACAFPAPLMCLCIESRGNCKIIASSFESSGYNRQKYRYEPQWFHSAVLSGIAVNVGRTNLEDTLVSIRFPHENCHLFLRSVLLFVYPLSSPLLQHLMVLSNTLTCRCYMLCSGCPIAPAPVPDPHSTF